jgi:hypothetical protein
MLEGGLVSSLSVGRDAGRSVSIFCTSDMWELGEFWASDARKMPFGTAKLLA